MSPIPVWLDCDPGHDDFFAILLLCGLMKQGKVNLLGISATYGNSGLEKTVLNVQRALWLCGLDETVPVVVGLDRPLAIEPKLCPEIHGESGLGGYDVDDPEFRPAIHPSLGKRDRGGGGGGGGEGGGEGGDGSKGKVWDAVESAASPSEAIARGCFAWYEESREKVWLIVTGCLTTAALLFSSHACSTPPLSDIFHGVSWMGGAVGFGNTSPAAEFNAELDPDAVASVLSHARGAFQEPKHIPPRAVPLLMSPLELTHTILCTDEVMKKLETALKEAPSFLSLLTTLLSFFADTYRDVFRIPAPPLHDPMAVVRVVAPHLITESAPCLVRADTSRGPCSGRTIVDLLRITEPGKDSREWNCDVATKADVEKVWDFIFDAIQSVASTAEERIVSRKSRK